jgi:hypothetical protein
MNCGSAIIKVQISGIQLQSTLNGSYVSRSDGPEINTDLQEVGTREQSKHINKFPSCSFQADLPIKARLRQIG